MLVVTPNEEDARLGRGAAGRRPAGVGAIGRGGRSRPRGGGWTSDLRIRRLRVPVLPASVSRDRTRRAGTERARSFRLPAFPRRPDPSARVRGGGRRRGSGNTGLLLGHARAALPSPRGARGR